MSVKFANNAFGTLSAGITDTATSITLASGQGARFPTLASGDYFYATLIDTSNNLEVVKVTARATDVLTVTRGQEGTTAQAFAIGDRIELRVTAGGLEDAANPYDKDTSSTGSFALPSGTTAQQPTAADSEGHIRYDTDLNVVTYSDGTDWFKVSSVIAQLSSVTGDIVDGASTTLTLTGAGFLAANLVVNFTQSADSIDEDVTVTPASDTSATVTVPAAVYNNVTTGNVVAVKVTNSDGLTSAPINKTALSLPSGGTVTTSGSYRIHTFTSSGTFTNTIPLTNVETLVIAGGGGGGTGGGGGAGGYRSSVVGETSGGGASAESRISIPTGTFTVTIGGGGSPAPASSKGGNGGNSSISGSGITTITSTGGGGGGGDNGGGFNGGSGGGGGTIASGTSSGGAGTSGQGYRGGNQNNGLNHGAGGGGAAGVGADGSSTKNGGAARSSSITGTSVARAGGGGGAARSGAGSSGTGGGGGAGNGNSNSGGTGGSGSANTGSGAGSGPGYPGYGTPGTGGSGVVIIRYQL